MDYTNMLKMMLMLINQKVHKDIISKKTYLHLVLLNIKLSLQLYQIQLYD